MSTMSGFGVWIAIGAIITALLYEFTEHGKKKIKKAREAIDNMPGLCSNVMFLFSFLALSLMWPAVVVVFARVAIFGGK